MIERPQHRVVEDADFEDDLHVTGVLRRTRFAGDVLPTDEQLASIVSQSQSEAIGMTYRGYRRFGPIEIKVQTLRGGRLSGIMSRIGLKTLIPYETKRVIDPAVSTNHKSVAEESEFFS